MIKSLTSFRFITALVVFLFHCKIHLGWQLGVKILDKFFLNGASFMTGFFVLSGFIMAHVYKNTEFTKRENIYNFFVRRFAKIYPVYLISTIIYFLIFRDFSKYQYIRVVINDLFMTQAFLPSMFAIGINGGTWSLSVEIFLYFLFPFLMIISGKSPKVLFFSILFLAITSLNVTLDNTDYIYANPIFRVGDFLCGIGFYFLCKDFKKISNSFFVNFLLLILLFLTCTFLGDSKYVYMQGQILLAPLFGLWICILFNTKSKFYNNNILEYLGSISYSFYMWQFASISLSKSLILAHPNFNLNFLILAALLFNVAIASISYHFIEEKFRKFILLKFTPNRI